MRETNGYATVVGPAVRFDPAALRMWLQEPAANDGGRAGELGIDEFFSRLHGGLLSCLDELLAALADDEQTLWRLQPGVRYVGFLRTCDGDGENGAIIAPTSKVACGWPACTRTTAISPASTAAASTQRSRR